MKISGQQYYWLIAAGLLLGLALFLANAFLETNKNVLAVLALPLTPLIFAAYVIVAFEIGDRFGPAKAVVAFVIFPIAIGYWFSRINGFERESSDS